MTNSSHENIRSYASQFVNLNADEEKEFLEVFNEVKIKKKQFIIQPGFVPRHRYFVIDGAMRGYVIGGDGQEHSVQLAVRDWWISDYNSYIFQQPASMFVVAVEDSLLLQISFEQEQKLKSSNHNFEHFFRIIAERSVAFMQRRVISGLTQSAEERYDAFLQKYPQMVSQFPQYVIASYLGMTTEFLSKIRNNKVKKN